MTKRFHRVAVLMGGPSSEREVSLRSGAAISTALRGLGYDVSDVDVAGRRLDLPDGVEAAFIALHGTFGEDGNIQQLLERHRVPYTGAGVEASRISFDKIASKRVFERLGIPTPRFEVLEAGQSRTLPLPVVVKPPREGSSVGVRIVRDEATWPVALADVHDMRQEALVEEYIEGRELTVGLVGDEVLPIVEIRPRSGTYDYESKYTLGATEYLVPAPVDAEVTRRCQDLARRVFQALGCRGMGRVDLRLTHADEPYVLEINTIPGFTETSLLPKAARSAGIEFPRLCETILNLAALDS
jgi:D-alanine-D-alanine ligase